MLADYYSMFLSDVKAQVRGKKEGLVYLYTWRQLRDMEHWLDVRGVEFYTYRKWDMWVLVWGR